MVEFFFQIAKSVRPRQWIKNLVIFSAITFTGKLFNPALFEKSLIATIIFSLISGGSYLINDLVDASSDKLHPFKKFRPIASGKVPTGVALIIALLMIASAIIISFMFFPSSFLLVVGCFLFLQLAYTFFLKHVTLFDVLAIASGFILRVFAGEVATGYHINIWLFLTVISLSLFLALGKRRSELTLLMGENNFLPKTRATLSHYSEKMLDVYLSMFSTATWLTYALYAFLAEPVAVGTMWGNWSADRKWLMATVPLVIYGVMRYLQLIYEKHEGESPEKILLSDRPLLAAILLWGFGVIFVFYFTTWT